MKKPTAADHFNNQAARTYDERNQKLAPISDSMHFLIQLALCDLPSETRALCVGVGTGAEILKLAKAFPTWTFLGLDPSAAMLDVCKERLTEAGIMDRCELIQGYVEDAPKGKTFDIALSILVAHFVKREDRLHYFQNMTDRLKTGGQLVNTEISFDLNAPEFPAMVEHWAKVQQLMGASQDSIANLPKVLREGLSILPPNETENILRQSGIAMPIRFFQAYMIHGWIGTKLKT